MVPISRATSCPVIVVPMLAPIIIHTACLRVISPELTKPTTITVVADDDWMTAVMTAPTSTPRIRLEVSFSRIPFSRSPATASRLLLIICIPHRKRPSPPSSIKTYSGFICNVPPDIIPRAAFALIPHYFSLYRKMNWSVNIFSNLCKIYVKSIRIVQP